MKLKPIALGISIMALAGATAHAQDRTQQGAQPQDSQQSMQQDSTRQQPSAQGQGAWSGAATGPSSSPMAVQDEKSQGLQASGREQGAYGNGSSATSGESMQSAQSRTTLPASELIGQKVVDSQGKDLGEIDEIIIDLESGNTRAAVLSVGGILGVGGKQVALPMSDIRRGQEGRLTASIDKEKLEDAEGFAKGQMPGMDDEYWARTSGASGNGGQSSGSAASQGATNGGTASQGAGGAQQAKDMNLVRASKLKGREVQDQGGNAVGKVDDVVVSITDGKVEHLVVDVKDAGQAQIKPDALSSGTGDMLVANMSREQIASQATPSREQQERPPSGQAQRSGGPPQERPRS